MYYSPYSMPVNLEPPSLFSSNPHASTGINENSSFSAHNDTHFIHEEQH